MDLFSLAVLELFVRTLCAGAFLWAGASKLRDIGFATSVARLTGFGPRPARAIALTVPPVELAIGVGLLAPPITQAAASVAILLLAAFTFVLSRRLLQGRNEPCGCFGVGDDRPLSRGHVVRNVAMAAALLPAATPLASRPTISAEVALATVAAAALAVLGWAVIANLRWLSTLREGVGSE